MRNALEVFKREAVERNQVVDPPDLTASFDEINHLTGIAFLDELERQRTGA